MLPQLMERHVELLQRRKDLLCCCMLSEEGVIGRDKPSRPAIRWCQLKDGSPNKAEGLAMDQCCQKELLVNELCACICTKVCSVQTFTL